MSNENLVTLCHTLIVLALVVAYVVTENEVLIGAIVGYAGGVGVQKTSRKGA